MVLTEPLTKQERMNLYWLTRISGFGAVTINKIWNAVQKREEIYNIEGMFLKEKGILPEIRNKHLMPFENRI